MKKAMILLMVLLCLTVCVACNDKSENTVAVQSISVTARGLSDGVLTLSEGDEVILLSRRSRLRMRAGFRSRVRMHPLQRFPVPEW